MTFPLEFDKVKAEMLTKETLFMKNRRIFSFDFIRVLAMLMIVVFHYNACWIEYQVQTKPLLFVQFANGTMGHIGVSISTYPASSK